MDLSDRINRNKRRDMKDFEQHIKNLAGLRRRLMAIQTGHDKRVNLFDPIRHPSLFKRSQDKVDRSICIDGFINKVTSNRKKRKQRFYEKESAVREDMNELYGQSL